MKCYTQQLAFASAVTTAILYLFGTFLFYNFPQHILWLWSPFYMHETQFISTTNSCLFNIISGTVQIFIYTYVYAWLLGYIYATLIVPE